MHIFLSLLLSAALGAQGEPATQPTTTRAVEIDWSVPSDATGIAERTAREQARLDALKQAQAATTAPAESPTYSRTAELIERTQQYLDHLATATELEGDLARRKTDAFLQEQQQGIAGFKSKLEVLQREAVPDQVTRDQVQAVRQEYDRLNQEINELADTIAAQEAVRTTLGEQAQMLEKELAKARDTLVAARQKHKLERNLPATTAEQKALLDRELDRAQVTLADLLLLQELLPLKEEFASLLIQQDTQLRNALKPYVVKLRERANEMERRQIKSEVALVRYRSQHAVDPLERIYYGLELLVLEAEGEFNTYRNPISDRFQNTTLTQLKGGLESIQSHWRNFLPTLDRRAGQEVLRNYRRILGDMEWTQKRLAELQTKYDKSVDELGLELQPRQRDYLQWFDEERRLFDEKAAKLATEEAARMGRTLSELRTRLFKSAIVVITDEQAVIGRLREGMVGLQACLNELGLYRGRLYRAHIGVRDAPLFRRPWSKLWAEWRAASEGRLIRERQRLRGHPRQAQVEQAELLGEWTARLKGGLGKVSRAQWVGAALLILLSVAATIGLRPRLAHAAEQIYRQTGEQPDFTARLRSQTARIAYRSAPVGWPCLGLLLALWSLRLDTPLARIAEVLLIFFACTALTFALVHGLFNPSKPRFRLIRCSNVVAGYYRPWLRRLLWLSVVLLPLPLALATGRVLPETRTLFAEIYKVVALLFALVFLLRRQTVLRVVGRADQVRMTHLFALVRMAYPLVVLTVLALFVAQLAGYYILTRYVVLSLAASIPVLLGGRLLNRWLEELNERYRRRADQMREQARTNAERRARVEAEAAGRPFDPAAVDYLPPPELEGLVNTSTVLLRWTVAVLGLIVVLRIWGVTLIDIRHVLSTVVAGAPPKQITIWRTLGVVVALGAAVLVSRSLRSVLEAKVYPSYPQIDRGTQAAINMILHYLLIVLGVYASMQLVYLDLTAVTVLMGMFGLGLGLGLQPLFVNFLGGLIMLFERHIKVGDIVDVNGTVGEVTRISLRSTGVRTFDNIDMVVPNGDFVTSSVINWSLQDRQIRGQIDVGVAYGSDVGLVRRLLLEIANAHPHVLPEPAPMVWFMDFGDNALAFKLLVRIDDVANRMSTLTELRFSIDEAFRKHGIVIPFPQRTLSTVNDEPIKIEMISRPPRPTS
ncbi:MAG TPA: mechanosensitive ion channel domain-containing protein [Phycisphaerae bacterium]|nr:mechanosensitive ion channel domain-containing protein [Phycisphaerae bacterium]